MNGYSILFAAVVILAIALILGTTAFLIAGGLRHMPQTPWQRRKVHHHH